MTTANRLYNQSLDRLHGDGVPQSDRLAFELCAQAAAEGHHDAVLAMGWHYLRGIGVSQNEKSAIHWYRRSARQGDARAMFSLGQIAYYSKNMVEAHTWFERAANHGHVRSLYWIGKLYWRGDAVGRDTKRAMALFQEAAQRRDPEARRFLRYKSTVEKRSSGSKRN